MNALRASLVASALVASLALACGSDGESAGGASPPGSGSETPATPPPPSAPTSDAGPAADAAPSDADAPRDSATDDAGQALDAALDAPFDAGVVNDDPFDPASCGGALLDAPAALAKLGAASHVKLASATLMRRSRSCPGGDPAQCGPWGAPVPHTQALLTYSGGVVTDYKTFAFPTHLVLFEQAGAPKMSVRHESDYRHDANASTRGVTFPFGDDPMVNTYPIIYVWDFAPAPNRYDDLQGLLGKRAELYARETCARLSVEVSLYQELAALYRY